LNPGTDTVDARMCCHAKEDGFPKVQYTLVLRGEDYCPIDDAAAAEDRKLVLKKYILGYYHSVQA
jgi:hypothetical protein